MSRYPIEPPVNNWSLAGFAVIVTCMDRISSVNPGAWKNFIDTDPNNGFGLLFHEPGWEIENFRDVNYPALPYTDGLLQIKYYETTAPWIYEIGHDWGSFSSFAENCTINFYSEMKNFLYQVGYCDQTYADIYANDWWQSALALYNEYNGYSKYRGKRNKWIARNGMLTADETKNNIDIIFSYSKGIVYKNIAWLLFKHKRMGVIY